MNWIERLENITLTITTGDGKVYNPLWVGAQKNISYNTEGFEFINKPGSYVERKEKKGSQYPLTLYFQGENHIDEANNFLTSAEDKRPWIIKHPFYDELTVQPLGLSVDNSENNITKITGIVWETISEKYPQEKKNLTKEIESTKDNLDTTTSDNFENSIVSISASSIQSSSSSIDQIDTKYQTLILSDSEAADLKNRVRLASSAAQEMISEPTNYINQAIDLINFPFIIAQDITSKFNIFVDVLTEFVDIFLGDDTDSEKQTIYESQATVILSSMASNAAIATYSNRAEVLNIIDVLDNSYDEFLLNLDTYEHEQNSELSIGLDSIITTTLSSLIDIAFESRQQRTFILDKDNNIVTLAHRFFGSGDDNLDLFMELNQITKNEYLGLRKGREITYYV